MTSPELLAGLFAAGACALPLAMTLWNLRLYRPAPPAEPPGPDAPRVFVCVPARDEADNIEACLRSILRDTTDGGLRALVYDDHSTDGTGEIVRRLAGEDGRVRLVPTEPLPEGWNGKQHACWRAARAAIDGELEAEPPAGPGDLLLFTDADVRFEPGAARRAAARMAELGTPLLSAFPRQLTGTLAEAALVPLMFYLLLGYLPFARMRGSTTPGTSAGCGQFLLITVEAYERSGGHRAFKDSMHDGIKMPRAVRSAGMTTDLVNGTDLASVRMYRGLRSSWRGFAKNAYEGLGNPGLLVFLTVLHLAAHALPWVLLPVLLLADPVPVAAAVLLAAAIVMQLAQRLLLAATLRHAVTSAVLHPIGVTLMTLIQWHSFALHLAGRRAWRGRTLGRAGAH